MLATSPGFKENARRAIVDAGLADDVLDLGSLAEAIATEARA
jgi:hypothetical protein